MKKYFFLCFVTFWGCVFPRNNESMNNEDNESSISETDIWVPIIENQYDFLVVSGTINNTVCNIMIDTGGNESGAILMDSAFFYSTMDTTGLVLEKQEEGFSLEFACYTGEMNVKIGEMNFLAKEIAIFKHQFSHFKGGDFVHNAIIGKLYYDKVLSVDFDENKLAFSDSLIIDTIDYNKITMYPPKLTGSKDDKMNKIKQHEKYIEVGGFINKQGKSIAGRFLFDTGCKRPLILKSDFGKKLKKPENYIKWADPKDNNEGMWEWKADSLKIGGISISNVQVDQSVLGSHPHYFWLFMLEGGDGLMGMELLKRFNFMADFKNNILYLKPSKHYHDFGDKQIE